MGLKPTISACLEDNCKKLTVTDTTGVYDSSDNTGGWGSPNISGSDVDTAEITVEFPDGSTNTVDVTGQVPDTVSGEFEYDPIQDSYPDGKYCIKYHIKAQESESLPTASVSYEDTSAIDGAQYTVEVDTTGDGTMDTEIGSYTAGSSDTMGDVYDGLRDDINNNSSFSSSNSYTNGGSGTFEVTAPLGTGSTYNSRVIEVDENGSVIKETSFNDNGSDAIDVDETYDLCQYFYCHTKCCVEKMKAKIPDKFCGCDTEPFIDDAMLAEGLLQGLKSAASCDDVSRADDMLERIKKLCDFNDCNCS